MFIAIKTDDGRIKGKISFYCKVLHVSRQAFNKYLKTKDTPWKYQALADAMIDICSEDECNDTYGRIRMYQALQLKQPEGVHIPGERTVYRVMDEIGLNHKLSDGTLWEGQIALYFRWTCLPDCAVPVLDADYRRNNRRLS